MLTRPFRYIRYVLAATALLAAAVGRAADPATQQAVLDDGQQRSGRLRSTDQGTVVFESGSASIPARRLARVEFPADGEARPAAARLRVWLWGGEQLAVQRIQLDQQTAQLVLSDESTVRLDRAVVATVSRSTDDTFLAPGRRWLGTDQDQLRLVSGDEFFGDLMALDDTGATFRGAFPPVRLGGDEIEQLQLRRSPVRGRAVRGLLVRLHLRNSDELEQDDLLRGAVAEVKETSLVLDHAHLGRLTLPYHRIRALDVLGEGLRVEVDAAEHHLGNDVRPKLPLPTPEGSELVRTFQLEGVPDGPAELVCDVVQLESAQPGGRFARELNEGDLRTRVWINEHLVDYLNRYVARPIDEPQPLRVPLASGILKPGENTLRISQTPLPDDKSDFDDFLLSNLAVEFPVAAAPQAEPGAGAEPAAGR